MDRRRSALAHVCGGAILIEPPIGRPDPVGPASFHSGLFVPTVHIKPPVVTGALDRDVVRRIVRARVNEVHHCYNKAFARDRSARRFVSLTFSVRPTGKVTDAKPGENTTCDPALGACIAALTACWTFPKPTARRAVAVVATLVLNRG